jgi:hypothetical protein
VGLVGQQVMDAWEWVSIVGNLRVQEEEENWQKFGLQAESVGILVRVMDWVGWWCLGLIDLEATCPEVPRSDEQKLIHTVNR